MGSDSKDKALLPPLVRDYKSFRRKEDSLLYAVFRFGDDTEPSLLQTSLCSLLHLALVLAGSFAIHDMVVGSPETSPDAIFSRLTSPSQRYECISSFFLVYYVFMIGLRCSAAADLRVPVYEVCWACNSAMLLSVFGPLTNRPLLASGGAIAVCIDQVLWYVDLLGYAAVRKFPVGVAKYLLWPETSNARRATSTHHLFTIPLVLWQVGGLHLKALPISYGLVALHVILSRLLTPHVIFVKGGDDGKAMIPQYLNLNLAHEVWRDIKFKFLQITVPNPFVYLPNLLVRWLLFNSIVFAAIFAVVRTLGGGAPERLW